MTEEYYHDYPNEPIGGDNPYYRCSYCKRSDPEINGYLERHEEWCEYRIKKTGGTGMTNTAYQIWETFKSELIVEPTDDMKEALATAIREVVIEVVLSYMQYAEWEIVNKIMEDINELADNVEAL
jgi:hypothetical protein